MKFLLSIHYMIWLVASSIFFGFGEYLSKKFALNPKFSYILIILLFYTFGALAWFPAILQKNQLSIVGTLWTVMGMISTVLIGVLIFQEKLSLYGIFGIILAVVAIILLSI